MKMMKWHPHEKRWHWWYMGRMLPVVKMEVMALMEMARLAKGPSSANDSDGKVLVVAAR